MNKCAAATVPMIGTRHTYFEELDEASGPEEWAEEYFEDWHPQDVVLFQEAHDAEQAAGP